MNYEKAIERYDRIYKRVEVADLLGIWNANGGDLNVYVHSPFCPSLQVLLPTTSRSRAARGTSSTPNVKELELIRELGAPPMGMKIVFENKVPALKDDAIFRRVDSQVTMSVAWDYTNPRSQNTWRSSSGSFHTGDGRLTSRLAARHGLACGRPAVACHSDFTSTTEYSLSSCGRG